MYFNLETTSGQETSGSYTCTCVHLSEICFLTLWCCVVTV